ncbi:baseplate assembly protein [Psychrobacter lutiphocae]|uniref:baseplate assembly protein n=1 Tax=Psychrobacter lutiphocae TaxID=540500 RepID=UPI000370CEA4|nr:baseplate J/gp47 family protein [Psychrobacter lutiphocae]
MDISQLPEPSFIERDANKITDALIAKYEELSGKPLYPAQADRLMVDVIAYREMMIRTAINEAAKQNLIAFADGVMLDYLGDFFGVVRLDGETDDQLRTRIRLAPESYATTGSRQAYIYHTLSTSAEIIDAEAIRGEEGNVYIHILTETGVVSDELKQAVLNNTSDEKKRPLSDRVHVLNGEKYQFNLNVKVYPLSQANPHSVLQSVKDKAQAYIDNLQKKLGQDVVPSQIIDVLSSSDIWQVEVIAPSQPLIVKPHQWAKCTGINITLGDTQDG